MELFAIDTHNEMLRERRRVESEKIYAILRNHAKAIKPKIDMSQFLIVDTVFSEVTKSGEDVD
jgi:hypothetical protein